MTATTNPNSTVLSPEACRANCHNCGGRGFTEPLSICLVCEGSGTRAGRYARLRELGHEVSSYHFALGVEVDFQIGDTRLTAIAHHPYDAEAVAVEGGEIWPNPREWGVDILVRGEDGTWIDYLSRGRADNVEQAAGFLRAAQHLAGV